MWIEANKRPKLVRKKQPPDLWSRTASSVEDMPRSNARLVNQHHIITHSRLLLNFMRLATETVALICHILWSTSAVASETGPLSIRPRPRKAKPRFTKRIFEAPPKRNPICWRIWSRVHYLNHGCCCKENQIWRPHLWPGSKSSYN